MTFPRILQKAQRLTCKSTFAEGQCRAGPLGGRAGTSAALIYNQASLKPSENSIGAIGEGIAEDYLENFEGLAFEVRPFEVSPDFIFKDSVGARILEVKASNDRFRPLVPVAVDLIDILAKSKLIRRGKYYA